MLENQDTEFKAIWKDEYLKWVCGMANSNGGIIYIGKNDSGNVIGVNNAIKLAKEIPNKIRDTMGIIPEVKIVEENELLYITIKIENYPTPISYQGKFYLRSGSNNHEVTGAELDKFMLDRIGKRWEDLPVKNATFKDLSEESFKVFKEKAVRSGRLREEDLKIDNETLLKNLGLYDGKYLNKACILLFGENPNKWIVGSYIKIGYFENNDADLRYQDEIQGPLILQIDKAIDLIYLKYMKALIHYDGVQRIEEYMFPREGFREILLNSVNHKKYEENNPIQISIYDDKIYMWNDGKFPKEISSKNLFEKHYSKPYNPLMAQTFFKAGFIESWGRGFEKIRNECNKSQTPLPEFEIKDSGVMVKCTPSNEYMKLLKEMKNTNVGLNVGLNEIQVKILELIKENKNMTQKEMAEKIGISSRTIERNIKNLKKNEILEKIGSKKNGYWKIK